MRQEGILIKWNDERGFGFIRPLSSAEEVFVHVSSFDRNGARPLLVLFGVLGYRQVMRQGMNQPPPFAVQSAPLTLPQPQPQPQPLQAVSPVLPATTFRCDGRQYCSQMTSCEEAKYFLRNCPDVKMDGDGDGIPCEDQFCGH